MQHFKALHTENVLVSFLKSHKLKILIVKLSSLGDVVHTLPAVMDIKEHVPNAQIDWVVERGFAPLLKLAPFVQNIICCDVRKWRKSWWSRRTRDEFKAFKHQLQTTQYDAVIDLQGLSKSALISWLAMLSPGGQRFAIGNQTEGASWEFMTRWAADRPIDVKTRVHAVERSRIVCAKALNYEFVDESLSETKAPNASRLLSVAPSLTVLPHTVALVHASSRQDKTWPLHFWTELGEALMARGFNIALPQGSDQELEQARAISNTLVGSKVWLKMGLDEVTAHLSSCVGVIGVDSGLSHIAEVLDLPLVQIYNFQTNWRTGPSRQSYQSSVFAKPTPSVQSVLAQWDLCWNSFRSTQNHNQNQEPLQVQLKTPSFDQPPEASQSDLEPPSSLTIALSEESQTAPLEQSITLEATGKTKLVKTPPAITSTNPQLGLFD
jgi:heptosyltransferase-1